ncbi:hypothetical protein HHI36_018085 [Cryptolaemus montrouzieri]|uniref:Uncharacterized protein n=1 Tax=Cryptolaemus montrouzieri TaxID=559131 RepID=A0ABD2NZX0_9CUCU
MEISSDFISISGILINAKAKYGDLSNIKDKGYGDEEKVSYVLKSLMSFLNAGKYMEDGSPLKEFKCYFEELSMFLIVNSEFSSPFCMKEYEHLTFNIPKISQYLLCRLITGLNITEYFCATLEKLP